jgi:hypothetical protein
LKEVDAWCNVYTVKVVAEFSVADTIESVAVNPPNKDPLATAEKPVVFVG